MTDLRTGVRSASAALGWGLRTYSWVLLLCAVQLAVLGPLVQALRPVFYEARALVVARQIELTPQAVPRFGRAIFEEGTLARDLVADPAIGGDAALLIPDRLRVVTPQDSVVFQVVGRDADPERAARLANVAALAFVTELNRPGVGVGNFALQDAAPIPTDPDEVLVEPVLLAAIGLAAGALLGLGIVFLIVTVRRPMVSAEDVENLIAIPVLGSVTLPSFRPWEFFGARGVPGIASVVRAIVDTPTPVVFVASGPREQAVRERVSVMVTLAARRSRPVTFRSNAALEAVFADLAAERGLTGRDVRPRPTPGRLTIVDGAEPLDSLGAQGGSATTVLVVPEGITQERLRNLASDFLLGEVYGIVIVGIRPRRRLKQVEQLRPVASATVAPAPNGAALSLLEALDGPTVAIPYGDRTRVQGSQSVKPN